MNRIAFIIILTGITTYTTRVLPMVLYKSKQPCKFVRSFLKYMPYGALGGLLFPGILTATGDIRTSLAGVLISTILILLKRNMILVVLAGIMSAYLSEILLKMI